jgi:phage pi2 protein 07
VAVYNLGEGEWFEMQKRINFSSSGIVKTPNQVAHRWRQIKRVMKRDMKKVRFNYSGQKAFSKHEWIIYTLRKMN